MPIIEVPIAFCEHHWKVYQQRIPQRSVFVFAIGLYGQLMQDQAFARASGCWREPPELWELPKDFTKLNEVLRSEPFRPWCCYLGSERREAAWNDTPFMTARRES